MLRQKLIAPLSSSSSQVQTLTVFCLTSFQPPHLVFGKPSKSRTIAGIFHTILLRISTISNWCTVVVHSSIGCMPVRRLTEYTNRFKTPVSFPLLKETEAHSLEISDFERTLWPLECILFDFRCMILLPRASIRQSFISANITPFKNSISYFQSCRTAPLMDKCNFWWNRHAFFTSFLFFDDR